MKEVISVLEQKLKDKSLSFDEQMAIMNSSDLKSELDKLFVGMNEVPSKAIKNLTKSVQVQEFIELYLTEKGVDIVATPKFEEDSGDEEEAEKNERNGREAKDSLSQYFIDITKFPLLSRDEEIDLFTRYTNTTDSDEKNAIREKILNSNLRLVVSVAKHFVGRGLDFLDLISEGNLGLMKALDRYDVTKGYKFSTYATWWIRQSVQRSIPDQAQLIRMPVHSYETSVRLARINEEYFNTHGHDLVFTDEVIEELAARLNSTVDNLKLVIAYQTPVSLNKTINPEEDDSFLEDFIPSQTPSQEDVVLQQKEVEDIFAVMDKCLDSRACTILKLRWGFESGRPLTLDEIGTMYGLTRERIRQIEQKSLLKLRKFLRHKELIAESQKEKFYVRK